MMTSYNQLPLTYEVRWNEPRGTFLRGIPQKMQHRELTNEDFFGHVDSMSSV